MPREGLMTAAAAARYLSCSVSTIRRMVGRGEIPHFRLGKLIRFRRSEIDAWLALITKAISPPSRRAMSLPIRISCFSSGVISAPLREDLVDISRLALVGSSGSADGL